MYMTCIYIHIIRCRDKTYILTYASNNILKIIYDECI